MKKKNKKEIYKRKDWHKRLIEYKKKIDSDRFTILDVPSFIEDYFNKDYKYNIEENKSISELKERLEKIRPILAKYYKCKEDELYLGDFNHRSLKDYPGKVSYKIIFGDANFYDSPMDIDIEEMQIIEGNANFECSRIKSLCNLKSIRGNIDCRCSNIESLGNLQYIGGDALFASTAQLESLYNVKKIGGYLEIIDSQINDLGNLQSVGKILGYCCGKKVENLSELRRLLPKKVEWNNRLKEYINKIRKNEFTENDVPQFVQDYFKGKYFDYMVTTPQLAEIKQNLHRIKSVLAKYYKCQENELYLGNINFDDQYFNYYKVVFGNALFGKFNRFYKYPSMVAKHLHGIQIILGNADFRGSPITDLGDLQFVGGNVYFDDFGIKSIRKVERIGGEIVGNEELKRQYKARQKKRLKKQNQSNNRFTHRDMAILTKGQHITGNEVEDNALVRFSKIITRCEGNNNGR